MASIQEQFKELQKTTVGKVIIIAVPLVVLAIIFFVVFTLILSNAPETSSSVSSAPSPTSASTTTTQETTTTEPGTEKQEPEFSENLDVFQPRDPFQSPIEETATTVTVSSGASGESTSSTSTATGSAQSTAKLLTLESTYDKEGTMYAKMKYGDASYEVKAGDQIDASPYKVLRVDSNSVTLLYGDDQLILNVGQEVYK